MAVLEQGALVFTFFLRGGGNATSVTSGDCLVTSTVRSECHVVLVVKWTNKRFVLARVVAGVFFQVIGCGSGADGEV